MKAYVLEAINDFHIEDVPIPQPKPGEVLVKVRAAGICGSDIPRIYTSGTYHYPLIPGHEFAGEVIKLGGGVEEEWLQKRVGVFPLIPCMKCEPCQQNKYEMCRTYNYLGSRRNGGFAEYVCVPVWNLIELPDIVTYKQAAMLEPLSVAVHAARQVFCISQTDTVNQTDNSTSICICGMGTIGLFLCAILLDAGFSNITVIGKKAVQKRLAMELGIAPEKILAFEDCDELQVDFFFDCVGTTEVVNKALKCTKPGGAVVLVGNPASDMDIDKQTYWKILRNQLTLHGTWNSSFTHSEVDDWNYVLKRISAGGLTPEKMITHTYSFDKLSEGFEIMRDKSEEYVKIMMLVQ